MEYYVSAKLCKYPSVCIISQRENKRILPSQNSVKNVQLGNSPNHRCYRKIPFSYNGIVQYLLQLYCFTVLEN